MKGKGFQTNRKKSQRVGQDGKGGEWGFIIWPWKNDGVLSKASDYEEGFYPSAPRRSGTKAGCLSGMT